MRAKFEQLASVWTVCGLAIVGLAAAGTVNLEGLPRTPIGAEDRFVDSGLVVVDTQTNLVWEKKTTEVASGANLEDLHDVDNTYTWCEATGNNVGPRCLGNATSWIGQVNAEVFAGFANWRVPTRGELLSIVDTSVAMCGFVTPCIDPIFGPTQAFNYWSFSEVSPNVAWSVIFDSGNLKFGTKNAVVHVRAVRVGP